MYGNFFKIKIKTFHLKLNQAYLFLVNLAMEKKLAQCLTATIHLMPIVDKIKEELPIDHMMCHSD